MGLEENHQIGWNRGVGNFPNQELEISPNTKAAKMVRFLKRSGIENLV